jgi:hypothetical protein
MITEFIVHLAHRPGTLAELCEAVGRTGVNIEALQALAVGDEGLIHFVVDDPERAATALDAAGIEYTTRRVIAVHVLDQPGVLADVARVMFEAGINIDSVYITTDGRLILGVDDLAGATQVASGLAVFE